MDIGPKNIDWALNVTKYNLLKQVLVVYLTISIFLSFILPLHYILDANIVLFSQLHLFDNFCY